VGVMPQPAHSLGCLLNFVIPVFKILAFGLGLIWCVENIWHCGVYRLGEFEPDPVHIKFLLGSHSAVLTTCGCFRTPCGERHHVRMLKSKVRRSHTPHHSK
jgi:hypothetical protein